MLSGGTWDAVVTVASSNPRSSLLWRCVFRLVRGNLGEGIMLSPQVALCFWWNSEQGARYPLPTFSQEAFFSSWPVVSLKSECCLLPLSAL